MSAAGRGRLETSARELARGHSVAAAPPRPAPVWEALTLLPGWLERARTACRSAEPEAWKGAEWLLDNDYLVARAIAQIRQDLPPGFYARLPRLTSQHGSGLPRGLGLATGLLRATQLQLSLGSAVRFVNAYQEGTWLAIAELWAFPTMLRLACLELLATALERLIPDLTSPFEPTPFARDLDFLEDGESVARALANLGGIDAIQWKDFFARTSRVETLLGYDPAGIYARMDFETRDSYRKAVEELARGSGLAEPVVAERVVARARSVRCEEAKARHVGGWLVGAERPAFEVELGYRAPLRARWGRRLLRRAGPLYTVGLIAASAAGVALPACYLIAQGNGPLAVLSGSLLALLPASTLGVTFVHWLVTSFAPARVLPKLDFAAGIAADAGTAVAVPVLVRSADEVPALIEQLEGHRLANPDPAIRLVLLSDHGDAPRERMPEDDAVERALVAGICELNVRHGAAGRGPFHLLHRPRRFNASEGCWMGWERKRGKLEEFDRLLAGEGDGAFSVREGDPDGLRGIRFVVTADADTLLPPGSVARLVSTLAHPLNRAEFDPDSGRVRSGYTVVQPRVEITPTADRASLFSRLYAGDTAIDIYTRAVSDIYQDLFGAGIYVGKGVYEVEPFRQCLANRVPENALASHDLFEGVHGRAGLASDIVLYEGFPTGYAEFARRWHRWVRGDWQLLPWLAGSVPGPGGRRLRNPLSPLARWQILDNLRRSLLPPALLVFLAAGWLALPGSPWFWTVLAVAAPGAYLFTDLVTGMARGRRRGAVVGTLRGLRDGLGRWFLAIAFLVQDAAIALDAVGRTLWRLYVSHRHLLEWTSAAHVAARFRGGESRAASWRVLWPGPVLSLGLGAAIVLGRPGALAAAAPLLFLWLISPELAHRLSRPRALREEPLGARDRGFLRRVARRTWLFFETFVGPDDHWLPPDNFQQEPAEEIAHRTSPTNIGMMFLSSVAACDLGFVGLPDLLARTRSGLGSLERLERYRGHPLNWYDTRSLEPLEPRYVSTVDSGNLAVSLLALKESLVDLAAGPVLRAELWDGLADVADLLFDAVAALPGDGNGALRAQIREFARRVAGARGGPRPWGRALTRLCEDERVALDTALARVPSLREARGASLRDVRIWLERLHHHLLAMQGDVETLAPWWTLLEVAPPSCEDLARQLADLLPPALLLAESAASCGAARELLAGAAGPGGEAAAWIADVDAAIARGADALGELQRSLGDAAARAEALAWEMDFGLLYDGQCRLFRIGHNVSADRPDVHHYDLLATEARLASFFAIVKRDVPLEHWFFLGRPITHTPGGLSLVSWGGSMFEFLMPLLLLRSGPGTLLAQSERAAVEAQRRYARRLGVPWGVSESGFASRDADHRYRYRAFGVPGLGLRRGLSEDLVVAPYATVLALAAAPRAAMENLHELDRLGACGTHGFIEALDFTPDRVPEGRRFAPVNSYMAHHQGMILAALDNALCGDALVRRLRRDARIRAAELLLHERIPRELPPEIVRAEEHAGPPARAVAVPALAPWTPAAGEAYPQVHALGNGRFASWVSAEGGGALRWHGHGLTRWLPDATRDEYGLRVYVRDGATGAHWPALGPVAGTPFSETGVVFHPHAVEIRRRHDGIGVRSEIAVSPGDDVEIRRLTLHNETAAPRRLTVTSFAEVVLAPPLEDERHPAFSNLSVHSEFVPELAGLIFRRRPRQRGDRRPVLLHRAVFDRSCARIVGFEADRRAFLGRNASRRHPRGVREGLSGSAGWTLDPAMALAVEIALEPNEQRELAFVTIAAGSPKSALELAERYATLPSLDWTLRDAASEAVREVQRLGLEPERLAEIQQLTSLVLCPHPGVAGRSEAIAANRLGQARLWGLALSGDWPVILLRVDEAKATALLRLLVRAHAYWRRREIRVDLVVLREGASGYAEPLREELFTLLHEIGAGEQLGRSGGIHLLSADQVGEEEQRLLEATVRVALHEAAGPLTQQLAGTRVVPDPLPLFQPSGAAGEARAAAELTRPGDLLFDNGTGGFSADGREYVIHLDPGERTPAPWSNVLANDDFGCVVTESGGGFAWSGNSGENRLTPWSNDAVADPPSDVLYLRDEETARVWTPTPSPAGRLAACQVRHGAGYTEWRQHSEGIASRLRVFVPPDAPVKVLSLELRNQGASARRITATYYVEWLLGALRSVARSFVVTEYEPEARALFARNHWNPDFADRVAFATSSIPLHGLTADRREFLGRDGDPALPAGLLRWGLSGRVDAGLDPCAALQVHLDLAAAETAEVVFVLGQGISRAHAEALAREWQDPQRVARAEKELAAFWDRQLGAVQLRTPEPAFDLLINRWLLYQALASRILARAGFDQAGGAIGFRDQLQDVLALLHADPQRTRAHLLECASRQFEEGDVLHWWHPPSGRGVRTRCSDDLLWLPYAVGHYVAATGDASILDEEVPFLQAAPLAPGEDDRYGRFDAGPGTRSLFEHVERALEKGVTRGDHGLPLIGSGDWNDGLNQVGRSGRGESVWLAWFAIAAIEGFASLCSRRADPELAALWRRRARDIQSAAEAAAWDGEWYMRAFDDEGLPWGSADCEEARIDSVAQSWSVLAAAADPERARRALAAAERELVREDERVVRLLWPPFDATLREPGYIKSYPPGIRENGGQYTHAAAWLGWAFAAVGDGDRAARLFRLINPIHLTEDPARVRRYEKEPYAIAADVGSVAPHLGRGGWTWYTGAAAWTWRLGVEAILGLRLREGCLQIDPCLPRDWGSFAAEIRGPAGALSVQVEDPERVGRGAVAIAVDGVPHGAGPVAFPTDGSVRRVQVTLAPGRRAGLSP